MCISSDSYRVGSIFGRGDACSCLICTTVSPVTTIQDPMVFDILKLFVDIKVSALNILALTLHLLSSQLELTLKGAIYPNRMPVLPRMCTQQSPSASTHSIHSHWHASSSCVQFCMKNMIMGELTKESVQRAIDFGISAQQVTTDTQPQPALFVITLTPAPHPHLLLPAAIGS